MKTNLAFLVLAVLLSAPLALGQGTAFTYQGRLTDNGNPANGLYDLQIGVHDAASSGTAIAGPLLLSGVGVTNGLFAVTLDFGSGVFNGSPRWLQIGVRSNGSVGPFAALLPRQAITPTPYAIQAVGITGSLPESQLPATVPRLNGTNNFTGLVSFDPSGGSPFTVPASGKKVANLNADQLDGLDSGSFWKTSGNLGTTPTTNFLGTVDNQRFELRANNQTVMSLNPSGNVGIGTMNPQTSLEVNGDVAVSNGRELWLNSGDNSVAARIKNPTTGVREIGFITGAPLAEAMRITQGGNIGIGTATPSAKLDVITTNFDLKILNVGYGATDDYGDIFEVWRLSGGQGQTFIRGRNKLHFGSNLSAPVPGLAGAALTIDGGNVGIGTTNPAAKLDVAGTVRATAFQGDASQLSNVIPPGCIMAYMGTAAPSGWLLCDGAEVGRSQYSALFAAIGTASGSGNGSSTFNLPDLRGMFLRGVDSSAGRDPDSSSRTAAKPGGNTGNAVGSTQADESKSHQHMTSGYHPPSPWGSEANSGGSMATYTGAGAHPSGALTKPVGGAETRPKNAYVNYIIKH